MSSDVSTWPISPERYAGTYLEFLGFRKAEWREAYVRLEMPVLRKHRNTVGILHGGVSASMLDIAAAAAGAYGKSDRYVSITVNLNCNFMAPHRSDLLIAEGELVRATKTLFFAESRIIDPANDRLCATATGTFKPLLRELQES